MTSNKTHFAALLALTMLSSPAHALVMTTNDTYSYGCAPGDALCNALSTTFSPLTVLVGGTEVDLASSEAADRLSAEAHGMADPVILTHIARETQTPVEVVTAKVLEVEAQGKSATPVEIANLLRK